MEQLSVYNCYIYSRKTISIWRAIQVTYNLFVCLFDTTLYLPWAICLTKSRFHEYLLGNENQSSFNGIACYNNILRNLNDVKLGFSYLNRNQRTCFEWLTKP